MRGNPGIWGIPGGIWGIPKGILGNFRRKWGGEKENPGILGWGGGKFWNFGIGGREILEFWGNSRGIWGWKWNFPEEIWEFWPLQGNSLRVFIGKIPQIWEFLGIPEGETPKISFQGVEIPKFLVFFQEGEDEEGRDSEKGELGIPGEIPGIPRGFSRGQSGEIQKFQGKSWDFRENLGNFRENSGNFRNFGIRKEEFQWSRKENPGNFRNLGSGKENLENFRENLGNFRNLGMENPGKFRDLGRKSWEIQEFVDQGRKIQGI